MRPAAARLGCGPCGVCHRGAVAVWWCGVRRRRDHGCGALRDVGCDHCWAVKLLEFSCCMGHVRVTCWRSCMGDGRVMCACRGPVRGRALHAAPAPRAAVARLLQRCIGAHVLWRAVSEPLSRRGRTKLSILSPKVHALVNAAVSAYTYLHTRAIWRGLSPTCGGRPTSVVLLSSWYVQRRSSLSSAVPEIPTPRSCRGIYHFIFAYIFLSLAFPAKTR
jgi:hypothetical protein